MQGRDATLQGRDATVPDTDTDTEKNRDTNVSLVVGEPPPVDLKIERDRKRLIEDRAKLHLLGSDWNAMAGELGLSQIEEIVPGSTREKSALARIREGRDFARAFTNIRASPWLRGEKAGPPCTFDWMINPANFQKIIEGNYNNEIRKAPQQYTFGAHR